MSKTKWKHATATTHSSVAGSATSVSLLAANDNRVGIMFYNDSTQTLYIAFAATASATAFTKVLATNTSWEYLPDTPYVGAVSGIWASANGNARIAEIVGG